MTRPFAPSIALRSFHRLLIAGTVGLAPALAAHAGAPHGPGAVFSSVEAAALDALAFAAQRADGSRREYGGAIAAAPGGFTYAAPTAGDRDGVAVRLGASDVAWYYTHGAHGDSTEDALNEKLSDRDQRMVDRVDPQRRPLFVRTPSGRVLRYGEGKLAVVPRKPARIAQQASGAVRAPE